MRTSLFPMLVLFVVTAPRATAQTLEPRAVVPAGGAGEGGGSSLNWTLGQPASATYSASGNLLTAGVQQPEGLRLSMNIIALLDGPSSPGADRMHDSLRTRGLLPVTEPYTALGHPPVGLQGAGVLHATALLHSGDDAVVDWVFVELRAADDAGRIDAARAGLLQRDGDVVDVDGVSPLRITAAPGSYHLALLHRNHLPVMTQDPVLLGTGPNAFDLSTSGTALHVPDALTQRNGRHLLWSGDVSGDGTVMYTGADNDRDLVLQAIGGTVPTNTVSGYTPTDVNMDGTVRYTGADNDRDPILRNIGGTVPTNVRAQPLP